MAITEDVIITTECAPVENENHGEIETEHPGYLLLMIRSMIRSDNI